MSRLVAIGDIHGCLAELDILLEALEPREGDHLVFVGDYVDRGPESRGVVDRVLGLARRPDLRTTFLKGNHEDMLLAWLGEDGAHPESFLRNGGLKTLTAYGADERTSTDRLHEIIPPEHLTFWRKLELTLSVGPFLFVHAGVSPLRALADQVPEDMLWIRDEFVRNRHRMPCTIVFGHTPQREVLFHLPYKIGIDTGCVYGNKLSAIDLENGVLWQVARGGRRTQVQAGTRELGAVLALWNRRESAVAS